MERKRNYEPVHEDYVEAVDQQQQSDFDVLNSEMVSLIESPSFVQSFSELATTSERIKFVLSHEAVTRLIANVVVRDNLDDDKKSYTKAAEFGQACVRALQADLYEEALTSQSSAIRYAPQDGSLLPIAFGNRSGAYFQLKQYEAALKDIEAAETHPQYKPDFLLTIRKCQCLLRLGRVAQAKKILDSIKRDDLNKGDAALLNKFYKEEGDHLKDVDEDAKVKGELKNKNIEDPELLKNVSSVIKILSEKGRFEPQSSNSSLSSKVEVCYNHENGRHLVTTEDVHFGDILAITKPYAAVLTPKQERHFCHHCLISLKPIPDIYPRTVPCTDCSRVLYCSEHCRTESWQAYHRFECSLVWNSFDGSVIGNSHALLSNYHLALRTLFVAGGLESIREITQNFPATADSSESADFTDNPKDYYENVYRMEMKEFDSIEEQITNIISVACLFEWSKLAEINDEDKFKAASPNVAAASKKDIFEMETLLRHYLQIFNRETQFLRGDQSALDDPTATVEFITTLDPLIGLVQQSLKPNTSIIVVDCARAAPHVSNVCVFFCIKPIPAGTVLSSVSPCYGDSLMNRIFLGDYVPGTQNLRFKIHPKFFCPCEQNCEDTRHYNPLGSTTTFSSRSTTIDGHELVCCGATCGGFIRRAADGQVKCCTCKRDIGPDEFADLKKIYSDIYKPFSQAKVLIDLINTLMKNNRNVSLAKAPTQLCTFLLKLETLINERLASFALKHSRSLLVDLYRHLNAYYLFCYKKESDKFDYLLTGWKYAEAGLATFEAHSVGGDSLGLRMMLWENVQLFSKASVFVRFALNDPIGLFPCLSLDDNREEMRNMLVRFVDSFGAVQDRLRDIDEYYKMT